MHVSARTVRALTPSDVVSVAQCIAIDAEAFPYPSAQFGLRSQSARVWVARDAARDGDYARVVGFIAGRVRSCVLHIEGLAVSDAVRRKGVGRALVREALERAQAGQLQAVQLHVSVSNHPAISLYESEGFVIARSVRRFYPKAFFGGQQDAYDMVRRMVD